MAGSTPSGRRSRRRSALGKSSPLPPQGGPRRQRRVPTKRSAKKQVRSLPGTHQPHSIHSGPNPQFLQSTAQIPPQAPSFQTREPYRAENYTQKQYESAIAPPPPSVLQPLREEPRASTRPAAEGRSPRTQRAFPELPHRPEPPLSESPPRNFAQNPTQNPARKSNQNQPKDIRLGPDLRRRPQLSSNPAFGRPRPHQRSGLSPAYPYGPQTGSQTRLQQGPALQTPPHGTLMPTAPLGEPDTTLDQHLLHQPRPNSPTDSRTQTLQPRPVGAGNRRSRSRSASRSVVLAGSGGAITRPSRRPQRPLPPFVYGVRLLIVGVGVGAIAGTLISALDPSRVAEQSGLGDRVSAAEQVNGADASTDPDTADLLPKVGGLGSVPKRSPYTALMNQLQAMANTQPELTPGVFALDLDTYDYADLNGSTTFSAASIIKVPVLVAFFQDVEQNKIDLQEMLTMEEGDVAGGSGDMRLGSVGDQYSALDTATKMIVISDNTATNMLIRKMGGAEQLNQRFQSWGLTATAIRNPLPDLEGTNTTSPAEMTQLLALINRGKLLSDSSREQMMDIMHRTVTATLLPAGIGNTAKIAHKTGDIGLMVGDTGIVDADSGKRYAVTIMMRRPHNDSRAQELIRKMAGVVHRQLKTPSLPATSGQTRTSSSASTRSTTTESSTINDGTDLGTDLDIESVNTD